MRIEVRRHKRGDFIVEVDDVYYKTVTAEKLGYELALLAERFCNEPRD